MDKKLLQKKLYEIYAKEYELSEIESNTAAQFVLGESFSRQWQALLDKATDLLEKCIKEGVRDD